MGYEKSKLVIVFTKKSDYQRPHCHTTEFFMRDIPHANFHVSKRSNCVITHLPDSGGPKLDQTATQAVIRMAFALDIPPGNLIFPIRDDQKSPITRSIAGLIFKRSSMLRLPTGLRSLALSMVNISSADKTNEPQPGTSTNGFIISMGGTLARSGMTTEAPVLLEIWLFWITTRKGMSFRLLPGLG